MIARSAAAAGAVEIDLGKASMNRMTVQYAVPNEPKESTTAEGGN